MSLNEKVALFCSMKYYECISLLNSDCLTYIFLSSFKDIVFTYGSASNFTALHLRRSFSCLSLEPDLLSVTCKLLEL